MGRIFKIFLISLVSVFIVSVTVSTICYYSVPKYQCWVQENILQIKKTDNVEEKELILELETQLEEEKALVSNLENLKTSLEADIELKKQTIQELELEKESNQEIIAELEEAISSKEEELEAINLLLQEKNNEIAELEEKLSLYENPTNSDITKMYVDEFFSNSNVSICQINDNEYLMAVPGEYVYKFNSINYEIKKTSFSDSFESFTKLKNGDIVITPTSGNGVAIYNKETDSIRSSSSSPNSICLEMGSNKILFADYDKAWIFNYGDNTFEEVYDWSTIFTKDPKLVAINEKLVLVTGGNTTNICLLNVETKEFSFVAGTTAQIGTYLVCGFCFNDEIYYHYNKVIRKVDFSTGVITDMFTLSHKIQFLNKIDNETYFFAGDSKCSIFNFSTGVVFEGSLGFVPKELLKMPDGNYIAISNDYEGGFAVINMTAQTVTSKSGAWNYSQLSTGKYVFFSGYKGLFAYSEESKDLYVLYGSLIGSVDNGGNFETLYDLPNNKILIASPVRYTSLIYDIETDSCVKLSSKYKIFNIYIEDENGVMFRALKSSSSDFIKVYYNFESGTLTEVD